MPVPVNRFVVLLLLLLATRSAFGQKKLSVAAVMAPVFTHTTYERRSFYPDSDGQIVEPIALNGVRWEAGFSAGFTVHYTYAPGWSVASGIGYRQISMSQERLPLAGEGTTTLQRRSVRIPLLLNFRSSANRLSPYFSLGMFVDFPMTGRIIAVRSGEPTQYLRLPAESGPSFQPMLGAGAQYQIDRRFTLILQPTAAYNLGRLGGARTYNPSYELSLQTQLAYTF